MADEGTPALHIDFDAMLRKKPPQELLSAPFCAEFKYQLKPFVTEINARLPHPRFGVAPMYGLAGGIQGGNDCQTISKTATISLDIAIDPKNRSQLNVENGYQSSVTLGEAAWCNSFPDAVQLLPKGNACRGDYHKAGYVHLAGLKLDRGALAQAELKVMHDWPAEYRATQNRFDE